ncbi:YraN family protein [uncultured Phascolarctobacterium sp.]|uniref:YraN family protein n=1 Tax=uncultured Phascolarctobacterium sp. TaxID=512296 RepID=UPI002635DEAE|nr:YraN family protein [uncultured Phascolarctobacterium sp.]
MCSISKNNLGVYGENLACKYLEAKGYVILQRNFRCRRYGEIDIIASKAGVLSFIEVKARASQRYGKPAEAVTLAKQRKIYRCAEYYLQRAGLISCIPVLSFDVVEVIIKGGAGVQLLHYPHCF